MDLPGLVTAHPGLQKHQESAEALDEALLRPPGPHES